MELTPSDNLMTLSNKLAAALESKGTNIRQLCRKHAIDVSEKVVKALLHSVTDGAPRGEDILTVKIDVPKRIQEAVEENSEVKKMFVGYLHQLLTVALAESGEVKYLYDITECDNFSKLTVSLNYI